MTFLESALYHDRVKFGDAFHSPHYFLPIFALLSPSYLFSHERVRNRVCVNIFLMSLV